jgi:hypothetical protein
MGLTWIYFEGALRVTVRRRPRPQLGQTFGSRFLRASHDAFDAATEVQSLSLMPRSHLPGGVRFLSSLRTAW